MPPARVFAALLRNGAAAFGLLVLSTLGLAAHDFDPSHSPIGPNGGLLAADDFVPDEGARISFDTILSDGTPLEARVVVPDDDAVLHEHAAHEH